MGWWVGPSFPLCLEPCKGVPTSPPLSRASSPEIEDNKEASQSPRSASEAAGCRVGPGGFPRLDPLRGPHLPVLRGGGPKRRRRALAQVRSRATHIARLSSSHEIGDIVRSQPLASVRQPRKDGPAGWGPSGVLPKATPARAPPSVPSSSAPRLARCCKSATALGVNFRLAQGLRSG